MASNWIKFRVIQIVVGSAFAALGFVVLAITGVVLWAFLNLAFALALVAVAVGIVIVGVYVAFGTLQLTDVLELISEQELKRAMSRKEKNA